MAYSDVLANVWLFSGMSKENLEKLEAFTFNKSYKPGDTVIQEGQTGNGLYVVTSGQVEVVKGVAGNTKRLAILATGDFFGEMSLLDEWPRSATVRALEETTCLGIDRWLFLGQLRKDPQLAMVMLQAMARRLRETDARLAQ